MAVDLKHRAFISGIAGWPDATLADDMWYIGGQYFFPLPEGVYSLDLDSGSFTISGSAITFDRTYILGLDVGSVVITGQNIDLYYSQIINLESGSIVITGSAITFLKTYVLPLSPGTIVITGSGLGIVYSNMVALTLGSFTAKSSDFLFSAVEGVFEYDCGFSQFEFMAEPITYDFMGKLRRF